MYKIIRSLVIIAISVLFADCDIIHQETIPSFIYGYYDINAINTTIKTDNIIQLHQSNGVKIVCDWKSKGNKKKLYDSLCSAHNDKGYNKQIEYFNTPEEDHTIFKYRYDYYSIDVTSDADFDEQHPAGTLLNDIIVYHGTTVKNFINSGYRYEYDWNQTNVPEVYKIFTFLRSHYYTPVYKKLSEMTPDDYYLASGSCYLVFEKAPTLLKEHKLTIIVKNNAGGTLPISFYANGTKDNPRYSYVPIKFE